MAGILNFDDEKIGLIAFDMVSGETTDPVGIRVVATSGKLQGQSSEIVQLKVREYGTADPYIDLVDGFDLSGYTPESIVSLDLICVALPGVLGLNREGLFIGVIQSEAAGWKD
jgi:hypothetical protein